MAFRDQIISLAGMFQAGLLVRDIAREGRVSSEKAYEACLRSILITDAVNTESVYGGVESVRLGLEMVSTLYTPENKPRDMEVSQYVLGIAHLERKLMKNAAMLAKMSEGIERVKAQTEHFELTHENVVSNIASVYVDTISNLQPRIIVSGEQGYLMQPENTEKVRALLFALMRSAVLWRQKGGRRWHLLFSRAKLLKGAQSVLNEL
ncbi:MAG: high frequency lysogenization protein HflD [Gammaproteobacteria bacterium]|nr:high frequency lysogenization protein HflD [Gammaproteobacteria bacterium]MDH5694541.1 high frequency lysogenization protein HflD [Gammaproteobacteria bacterium]